MTDYVDTIVIGAGVIGLACARSLAISGREVIVLEQHGAIGTETSSRNSEVIHAGIYYPRSFLKTTLCVQGKHTLYDYCQQRGIEHKQTGKLIVASDDNEKQILDKYFKQANENGVGDLRYLDKHEIAELEPDIVAKHGLFSPSTGIINTHDYMLSLQGDIESNAGIVACNAKVTAITISGNNFVIEVEGNEQYEITCSTLINAAGLHAWKIAQYISKSRTLHIPSCHFAIGHYYNLSGSSPFSHLVYPLAQAGGLGVHVTLDMAGQARFGPDVQWVDDFDYSFNEKNKQKFIQAIAQYYPEIVEREINPAYTGIRPKISGPGEASADFLIEGSIEHGIKGLVNLYGIESPGLTSSLAIAEYVKTKTKIDFGS